MVGLVNISKYPTIGFEHRLLVGNLYFITILKQSFELKEDGTLKELNEQIGIRLHDDVQENARWDSVLHPSDLTPHKPKPEVILNGIAKSATAKKEWVCGIDIKQLKNNRSIEQWSKQILVTGERYWYKSASSWHLQAITPITQVSLNYENAYGGHYQLIDNQQSTDNSDIIDINYPSNPSGCGWLPDEEALKSFTLKQKNSFNEQIQSLQTLKAPQLFIVKGNNEQNFSNLSDPKKPIQVAGFGAYTNFWQARHQYIADDLDWSEDSAYGGYPVDFDMKHWQQAPTDQWLEFELKGNEIVTLTGFFPEGKQSYQLPNLEAYIVVKDPEQMAIKLSMAIDTLIIDTEKRTLEVLWRRIVLLSELGPETVIVCNAISTL